MPRARDSTHDLSIINQYHSFIKGPDLLHNLVAPSSTAIAIDFLEDGSKRRKFSFKTLHLLSDALAQNILISLEKLENASSVVPVLLPQCPELYVVILAILKAGKAFCPLSLDTPADRLDFILKDISADLLITDSGHGGNIQIPSNIMTLHVDHELFQRKQQHSSSRASYVHTNDLAYVLYTSGSTGMPKAVGVSHRAVTQSLLAHDRHIPHFTRFLQFAAPTFDVSIFEIFFPWYRERTLTSRTRARMLDNLAETIRTLDVDAAELTPTVVSNLLEGRSSVPSLKLLLTIGEMLTPDVIEEYGESDTKPGILWAMYGPTEAAIHCTLQPRLSASASTNIIGFPLDTVSAFIVSPISEGQSSQVFSILPVGEEGELAIGGPQVAERYLNRPELTAMSFLQHPNYGYVYRTGDRAKLRTDGMIECFGRIATGQVKWRGQRVELGEIEETIMKIGSCRAVTVMIIEEVVVAFCATGSREVLRAHVLQTCKQWLPTIMIPSEVIFMHTMPQLPSGKIDRSSLVTTYKQALHRNGSEMMTSNTVANHSVIDILQHCLRLKLAQDANLASAGLDSLRAIQIASRLRAKGYNLTALSVLSAITVDDLLRNIESTETMNGALQHSTLDYSGTLREEFPELQSRHTEIANIFPCTPLQEAMLAETVARPKAYCNWIEIEFSKLYTIKEIRTALQRLTQQNEILRSGFNPTTTRGGTFVQVVWNKLDESRICRVNEFCRLFSLGSYESMLWPLSVQVRTLSRTTQLLFQVHHALYDGWSFDLILQDLEDLLQGNNAIQRPQFRDVIQFYDEHRHEPRRVEEDYWANLLRDFPETPLPNYNGRVIDDTATRSFVGRSAVKLETLHEHSRELMISPQVYFQAAVAFVVSLYVGSSDVVIGNVTSGRMIPVTGIEDIIGPCISSVPFRLQFTNWATARDILQETQRLNRESLKHTSLPLRNIAKVANMRVGARPFDVLFVWQQSLYSASNLSNSASITGSADELEFKITLEFEPRSDHVSYRATFDPSTVSKDQIRYLFQQIDEVVQLFLERADCKTTDIATCFSPNLCSIANPKPRQYSIQHGLSHAIERWAMTTPDRMALVFSHRIDGVMRVKSTATYIALNRRANQLAHVLSDAGVRQGHLVAVIMQKSIDLYVAVLAISKLGAGYLPLVPDLPSERMKTILSDAQVALCISDASSTRLPQLTSATIIYPNEVNFSAYSDHNVNTPYDGANAAYAVFTSGSTGTPKGVLVTQENLMSNLDYLSTIYPYSTESKLLQSCSQAFDVSVFEIFFSWHTGICLCTATKDDLFADLEGAINHFGITHLSLTPTVAALIDPENVPQVEFLVTAGEAVTEVVRRKWAGRGLYQGEIHYTMYVCGHER
jgi:amino acid adenylation domain-containing protein